MAYFEFTCNAFISLECTQHLGPCCSLLLCLWPCPTLEVPAWPWRHLSLRPTMLMIPAETQAIGWWRPSSLCWHWWPRVGLWGQGGGASVRGAAWGMLCSGGALWERWTDRPGFAVKGMWTCSDHRSPRTVLHQEATSAIAIISNTGFPVSQDLCLYPAVNGCL